MSLIQRSPAFLEPLAARALHALWAGLIALTAIQVHQSVPLSAAAIAGWAAAAAPGLLGLVAGAPRGRADAHRFIFLLSWTLPGFAASAAFGGAISPAALVFLTGPAAAAATGRREDVTLSGVIALTAFAVLGAFSIVSPVGAEAAAGALTISPAAAALLAVFFAAASLLAGVRATGRLNALAGEVRELKPAADAFTHAPEPLVACDADGRIRAASRSVRRLVPGAPRSLDGLPLAGLAFDEAAARTIARGLTSAEEGGSADGGRFVFDVRGGRGEAIAVDARAANAGEDGLVLHLTRTEAEAPAGSNPGFVARATLNPSIAALQAERDEAIAASRAKSDFLASVSHELRTPLNAIIGFSDVMTQRLFGPMPARYAEYADMIHESGRHLLDLIGDVLDMSKIEADRYELTLDRFDARDVVDTCTKMLRLRARDKGVVLSSDTGDAAIDVEADRKALRQILLNLLSNAVKFTPDGGAVAVMARAHAGELVLAVGDSGVGIEADAMETLGERYAQAGSARECAERGTGLGLSLVKALAEMHGGSMNLQSRRGEGTTVTVRLPVIAAADAEPIMDENEAVLDVRRQIELAQRAGDEIAKTTAQAS